MLKNKFLSTSILSGILIGTSFIPFPPWASLFAFVPLWSYWLQTNSAKNIFWSGWLCQFILTLIGFNWIIITIHDFGNLPWIVAALGLFAFCSFTTIYIPIAGLIYASISKKIKLSPLQKISLMALLLSLLEPLITTIFPWNFGYTWMKTPLPLYQTAEFIGFEGISSITIWLNILSFCFFKKISYSLSRSVSAVSLLLVVSIMTFTGYFLQSRIETPDSSFKIGIIQANIGNLEEQYRLKGAGFRGQMINEYLKLSKKEIAANNPDIVIWPETAAPVKLGPKRRDFYNQNLKKELIDNNISLIAGSYTLADTGQTSNSMVFFDQGKYVLPFYSKTHLLAFGEYIPGSQFYPKIKTWLPQISDFKAGTGPQITTFKNIKFGTQICYESLFPSFTKGLALLGAEVLVNVTNDSWYGDYMEPQQHLYMTLARAIESRRPLIRSTNTGISTVILADGEILERSPMSKVWTHTYNVLYKKNPKITFYNQYPYLFLILKILFILIIIIMGIKSRTHEINK